MSNKNAKRSKSPPSYFWKVSAPENKDHMTENYRRMKNIAAEGQKKRTGPLKANFIPGVTKNSRYAHIESKVTASLKAPPVQKSHSDDLANRRLLQSQKFVQNGDHSSNGMRAKTRPSRSSYDLRCPDKDDAYYDQDMRQPRREMSTSASNFYPRPVAQSSSQPSLKILHAEPLDESVYKWRFNDSPPLIVENGGGGDGFGVDMRSQANCQKYPMQQVHRVEYLPCDGICAEESHGDDNNLDSARSNSSRTSRGCNTEETRLIGDRGGAKSAFSLGGLNMNNRCESEMGMRRVESQPHLNPHSSSPSVKQPHPFNHGYSNGDRGDTADMGRDYGRYGQHLKRNTSSQSFDIITGDDLETGMKGLKLRSVNKNKLGSTNSTPKVTTASGDLPHSLGTVPKYLKQRQQEWKEEEAAKVEAHKNSQVPPGYICLTEDERINHLNQFKKNYDALIGELNRIPITIDTIRIREHKTQLEQKLTRLEEVMKNFARPVVWVKADT